MQRKLSTGLKTIFIIITFKGIPAQKTNFGYVVEHKKYEEIYCTLWCKNAPNKS